MGIQRTQPVMSIKQAPGGPQSDSPAAEGSSAEQARLIGRLFCEHNEALIRFLIARTHSRQEAREIAQEAYVRLLSLDKPGAVSYLRAFLFKTAANIATDRRRRHEAYERAAEQPLFQEFVDARTPERRIADDQTLQRLRSVIAAL